MSDSLRTGPAWGRLVLCLCTLAVLGVAGCANPGAGWLVTYDAAEQAATDRGAGIVVFYRDHLDPESGAMFDALNDPRVRPLLAGKVKCSLVTEYEPNQRYVAQYGVESSPALIVVHPDQTYHALERMQSVEQVATFLENARPPGGKAQLNPQVPRRFDYRWEGIYEDAVAIAKRQNRPLLIVYKWWLSGESTELLRRMSRPEVARHFANMAHCLLDWDYVPNRRHMARYGVQKVPAIVIVHQDETYHAQTGLCGIDELVRFVVGAKPPGRVPGWQGRTETGSRYRWHSDFTRASVSAGRQRQGLFVFFRSVVSDDSASMEQLLDRSEVADLFANMTHCKLDWTVRQHRELMVRYGVRDAPAFVIIRPDGTYHARMGKVRVGDLVELVRAAQRPGALPSPAR